MTLKEIRERTFRDSYGPVLRGSAARVESLERELIESISPATSGVLYKLAEATPEEIDGAVWQARNAGAAWRKSSGRTRRRMLLRVAEYLDANAERLGLMETLDNGKLLRDSVTQVRGLAELFEYFAGWTDKVMGEVIPTESALNYVLREPLGVVAILVPWNSPLNLLSQTLAPALAMGNAAVVKPSEYASASVVTFCEELTELGVPAGLVTVVTGRGATTGARLCEHGGLDCISFTGGDGTGRRIAAAAAQGPIPVVMELGGKSPQIIFGDADMDRALVGVTQGIFGYSGETCVAGSRCLVAAECFDEFLGRVVDRARSIRVGDPLDDESEMGPVAHTAHLEFLLTRVSEAVREGATLCCGGRRMAGAKYASGCYMEPTVIVGVRNSMEVVNRELFGPVLVASPFLTEAEAVEMANDTRYGLAASVWTRDIRRAHRVAHELDAGKIWINTWKKSVPGSPFGGFKGSGYGKNGGRSVLEEYTREKSIWVELSEAPYDVVGLVANSDGGACRAR